MLLTAWKRYGFMTYFHICSMLHRVCLRLRDLHDVFAPLWLFCFLSCQRCRWCAVVAVFVPSSFQVLLFYSVFFLTDKKYKTSQHETLNITHGTSAFQISCLHAYFFFIIIKRKTLFNNIYACVYTYL